MVPLYAARVGDLEPGDFVLVERRVRARWAIVDLAPRPRCRESDAKGKSGGFDQMGGVMTFLTTKHAVTGT
jgi:hypothetical protein